MEHPVSRCSKYSKSDFTRNLNGRKTLQFFTMCGNPRIFLPLRVFVISIWLFLKHQTPKWWNQRYENWNIWLLNIVPYSNCSVAADFETSVMDWTSSCNSNSLDVVHWPKRKQSFSVSYIYHCGNFNFFSSDFTWNQFWRSTKRFLTQCGNFIFFLSLKFYVKSM